jgi:hypothetical protein
MLGIDLRPLFTFPSQEKQGLTFQITYLRSRLRLAKGLALLLLNARSSDEQEGAKAEDA